MSEDSTPQVEQPAIVDTPENDEFIGDITTPAAEGNGKKGNAKKGNKKQEQKEQVPIEELYDLSKPIKRPDRPSKDEHDAAISSIDSAIDNLRAERRNLQSKIDSALGSNKNKNSPLGRERETLNKLKNRKGLYIEQKRQIRSRLEINKTNADRITGQAKNARSGMKFTNVADINKEISRLQRKQETTSMSLADEKKLLKEIEALQVSRRTAEELQLKHGDLNSIKQERKLISADLTAKDKEIDSVQKQIDEQAKVVKKLSDKHSSQRGAVDDLIKAREDLKDQLDAKFKEKGELKKEFREMTNEWYQAGRAIKAQKQLQFEEEKKKRDEEHKEWLKKKEEEELSKTPYEEEMALCDYLADYLTKAYLTDAAEEAEKRAKAAEEKAKADVVAVKDDPFAGFTAMSKNKGEDEVYFGKGKGGKKTKSSKNKASKPAKPNFSINLDLFEQFGMLNLSPPTNLDVVQASVEELTVKKQWYSEQPRGSVLTVRDIRKKKEEAAAKSNGKSKSNRGGSKNKGNFDISKDDDFAPLGA